MRTKNSIQNISVGLIGQITSIFINFVVRTIFIQILGSTYLGVSGLFGNILTILSLTELGFAQAMTFALYKPIADNDYIKIDALMHLYKRVYQWLFVVIACLGFGLTPFLDLFVKDIHVIPNLRLIYMMYVVSTASTYLFTYKTTLLYAAQKSRISNGIGIVFNVVLSIIQIIILYTTHDYYIYLGAQIVSGILQNATISKKTDKLFPFLKKKEHAELPKEEIVKIKNNVKALAIYKIGSISLNSTDNIIIAKFVGILTVGYYSNYLLLCSSVTSFLSTIFGNLTGSIGNFNAKENVARKLFLFRVINTASWWLYSVWGICLYNCMTPFIHWWIGDEYVLPNNISAIMVINLYISGMLYASFNYRQTMGLFIQGKMRPVVSAILNIVLSVIFAMRWGLAGVLWGTAITRIVTNLWYDPYIVFKRGLKCSPWIYFRDFTKKTLLFGIIWWICTYIPFLIPHTTLFGISILAIVSFVFCNFLLWLTNMQTSEYKYLYNIVTNVKSILKSK